MQSKYYVHGFDSLTGVVTLKKFSPFQNEMKYTKAANNSGEELAIGDTVLAESENWKDSELVNSIVALVRRASREVTQRRLKREAAEHASI